MIPGPGLPKLLALAAALALSATVQAACPPAPEEPCADAAQAQEAPLKELGSGLASWYGPRLQGRRTASGERFDHNGFTAAHPSLPFGTWVRVRNPRNGREVVVRINDRGPHVAGRIIDLSRAAARALGLLKAGAAPVVLIKH